MRSRRQESRPPSPGGKARKPGGNLFGEPRKAFANVLTLEGFGLLAFGAGMASCGVRYQALAAIAVGVAAVGAGFAAKALFGGRTRGRR